MVDYFILKQATYKNILDNFDKIESTVLHDITDYSKEDYFKILKSSMRMTYFHSIETLFELIFAIEQGITKEVNEHQDELILERLAASNFRKNLERIAKIANSDNEELEKWDKLYKFKKVNEPISLLRYIFYYILTPDKTNFDVSYWDKLEDSLKAIKSTLILLAKDFADRKEYNSYKHGLRVLPLSIKFQAFNTVTKKEILSMDYNNSMTFIHTDKKKFCIITKWFDTERDFRMTIVVSDFISSIINIRKGIFFNTKEDKTLVEFFDENLIKEFSKSNIRAKDLKITFSYSTSHRTALK